MSLIGAQVGNYRIKRRLGEGGVGEVYEATHEVIGGRVAIKILREAQAREQEWVSRLFDEARAVNLIDHDGLVKVVHYGQLDDGRPYLVMEFVSGQTLDARLQAGRLGLQEILHIGYQMALALQAAHAAGIVHRDLKPSNLMLVADPAALGGVRVKILDFGIAKLPRVDRAQRTQTGMVFGTPAYMSPEQFRGTGQVDARSDVYSLGVLLYELFAGQRPFEHDEPVSYMYSHCNQLPPPLAERAPGLSQELMELVERMLAKERLARPDMAEVAASLETQLGSSLRPKPSAMNTPVGLPAIRKPSEARRSRPLPLIIAVGVIVLGGALAWRLVPQAREGVLQSDTAPATIALDMRDPAAAQVAAFDLAEPPLDLLSWPAAAKLNVSTKPTATQSPTTTIPEAASRTPASIRSQEAKQTHTPAKSLEVKPNVSESTATRSPSPTSAKSEAASGKPASTRTHEAKPTSAPFKPTEPHKTSGDKLKPEAAPAAGSDSKKRPTLNPNYMPRTL